MSRYVSYIYWTKINIIVFKKFKGKNSRATMKMFIYLLAIQEMISLHKIGTINGEKSFLTSTLR